MPTLRDLLAVLEDAPGDVADICCALHPRSVGTTAGLLQVARERGLACCSRGRWSLTDRGRATVEALAGDSRACSPG